MRTVVLLRSAATTTLEAAKIIRHAMAGGLVRFLGYLPSL